MDCCRFMRGTALGGGSKFWRFGAAVHTTSQGLILVVIVASWDNDANAYTVAANIKNHSACALESIAPSRV